MSEEKQFKSFLPEEVADLWEQYLERCKLNREEQLASNGQIKVLRKPLIPSYHGFCTYAKIGGNVREWMLKQPHYPLADIREACEGHKAEALINGKGSAAGLIFTLKSAYGWKDKSEQSVDQKITIEFKDGATIL